MSPILMSMLITRSARLVGGILNRTQRVECDIVRSCGTWTFRVVGVLAHPEAARKVERTEVDSAQDMTISVELGVGVEE